MGDRVGEGSEYRNRLCRVTTHIETTGRSEEKGARQTVVFFLSLCRRGFQDLLKVRPSSLLMLCGFTHTSTEKMA